MLHLIGKNPATLDVKPLSHYKRTLKQLEAKALAREGGCYSLLEYAEMKAKGISSDPFGLGRFNVVIFRQGSFTIACITEDSRPVSFGYAKRNAAFDADNPAKSENIAVHRAISNCFVEEIKELDRPADSYVYAVPAQWSKEDIESAEAKMSVTGTIFEVNRIKPVHAEYTEGLRVE